MHLQNGKSVLAWAAFALLLPLALRANAAGKLAWLTRGRARAVLVALCALAALHELAQALLYATHGFGGDPYEASIAAVSAAFAHGQPIYPDPAAPLWYVQIGYGPVIYVLQRLSLGAFGPSIAACKLPGVLSFAVTLGLTLRTYRSRAPGGSWLAPVAACAVLALAVGRQTHMGYSMRTDPELVTCAAAAVWALEDRSPPLALRAAIFGLALGLAVNLKLTAVLYFVPMLALGLFEIPFRHMLVSAAVAAVTAVAPFLLPHVSLQNYLYWLGTLKAQGIEWPLVPLNFFWTLYFVMPLAFAAYALRGRLARSSSKPQDRRTLGGYVYAASLALALLLLVIVASKPGASIHHLVPLFPALIQAFARATAAAEHTDVPATVALVFALSLLFSQVPSRVRDWPSELATPGLARALEAELREVVQRHPGRSVEMAPAASPLPDRAQLRAALVEAGEPYVLDQGTVSDLPTTGAWRLPASMLARIERCAVDVEVVPQGGQPYGFASYYTGAPVFPPAYRAAFEQSYAEVEHLKYYDVYTCTHPSDGSRAARRPAAGAAR